MNKIGHISLIFALTLINNQNINTGSWSTCESTGESRDSRLEGTVITQENKQYSVSDIKIGGLYKDISVYDLPASRIGKSLAKDPYNGTRIWIDLANVKEIRVPAPDTILEYKDPKKNKSCEYIEIQVISLENTENRYLIETKHKITFRDIKGGTKIEVPFIDLKALIIGGNQRCVPA